MKTGILTALLLAMRLVHPSAGYGQLTATIVGSGSPVYDQGRAGASVLISGGDTRILVDMGNGTQANLDELGVDDSAITALLITHHHLDHTEEFLPILVHSLMGRHDFSVVGPPGTTDLTEAHLRLYAEDLAYRLGKSGRTLAQRRSALTVRDIEGGETFDIGGIRVSTLVVPHAIHTIAYRFDLAGESVVVTGDLTYTDALSGLAEGADFMIIDSGGMIMEDGRRSQRRPATDAEARQGSGSDARLQRPGGGGARPQPPRRAGAGARPQSERAHLNLSESSLTAEQAGVRNLVYTHLAAGRIDQEASLDEIRKNFQGNVIFGEDLMVLGRPAEDVRASSGGAAGGYPIVDTGQRSFYGNEGEIPTPSKGSAFYGQDAQYAGNAPSYTDNGDGTISDEVSGLTWQRGFDVLSYDEALGYADTSTLGGFGDWRLPTIKEMYSLILFSGVDASNRDMYSVPAGAKPFIDTDYFDFRYGANGDRVIDSQFLTSTIYTGRTMLRDRSVFGVNLADGRIKGYPLVDPRSGADNDFSVRLVRGNARYGLNQFVDGGDGTIGDLATGLTWAQDDSGRAMDWEEALAWVARMNEQKHLGHDDWRLPDAKELHSIVDYSRSPQATGTAAIDPVFNISTMEDERGSDDYPSFWSSTTHLNTNGGTSSAVYICFGEGLGFMRTPSSSGVQLMDVHGAGAQRSDPKAGSKADYPQGRGPQGDVVRMSHFVRLVRGR